MFIFLAVLIVVSFVGQVFVTRHFIKKLSQKVLPSPEIPSTPTASRNSTQFVSPTLPSPLEYADKPEKNHVTEENLNEVDYTDGMALPKDVKVEVEGGDTQVPPGYATVEKKVA